MCKAEISGGGLSCRAGLTPYSLFVFSFQHSMDLEDEDEDDEKVRTSEGVLFLVAPQLTCEEQTRFILSFLC